MKTYLFLLFLLITSSVYSQSGNVSDAELEKQSQILIQKADSLQKVQIKACKEFTQTKIKIMELQILRLVITRKKAQDKNAPPDLVEKISTLITEIRNKKETLDPEKCQPK